jgi:tellurite methyltransferase
MAHRRSQPLRPRGVVVPVSRLAHVPNNRRYAARFDLIGWDLVRAIARLKPALPRDRPRLLDLGTGRGRDVIFLARVGYAAGGIDIDPRALRKGTQRAARFRIPVALELADMQTYRVRTRLDAIFSTSALNHLPPSLRARRFAYFKTKTVPGGIHAMNAFVRCGRDRKPSDLDPGTTFFRRGELAAYYRGWELLAAERRVYGCRFGGARHRHMVEIVIARRPG